ncbi:lipase family protein [Nocardia stercoris]|uniref:lipase family protein n=1 Tax=Nocardia stercoris TaxID=2483361 RepID=UPI00131A3716|nr:lipase family protein [Nocardia stercoris]
MQYGYVTPSVPVFLASAEHDEGAPFAAVRAVAGGWCGRGTAVELESNGEIPLISGPIGTHVLSFFPALVASNQWITDRLAGIPAPVNCAP